MTLRHVSQDNISHAHKDQAYNNEQHANPHVTLNTPLQKEHRKNGSKDHHST